MGKYETIAGLLTLVAGLANVATAGLELAKAAMELHRARRARPEGAGEHDANRPARVAASARPRADGGARPNFSCQC